MSALPWPEEPPPLSDGVVTLRPWRAADVDDVVDACQDPEVLRRRRVPSPYTRSDAVDLVEALLAERLGYRLEGVLRDRLLLRGTRRDVAVHGLLATDLRP